MVYGHRQNLSNLQGLALMGELCLASCKVKLQSQYMVVYAAENIEILDTNWDIVYGLL